MPISQKTSKATLKPIAKKTAKTVKTAVKTKSVAVVKSKQLNPQSLLIGKHVVCFWKQNDLGLFGRRPDRWIQMWEQDPHIEKIVVFEMPLSAAALNEWLNRAIKLDPVSGTEYRLLLDQAIGKLQGKCDTSKTIYKTYVPPPEKTSGNQDYLYWVIQQIKSLGIHNPSLVLWPACFVNESLVKAINPCQIVTDIIDDQRLFTSNAKLVPAITSQYATWLRFSDVVVCNSEHLIASLRSEFGRQIMHLPNELLVLPDAPKVRAKPVSKSNTKKRTVIGYVGNMRERMDTDGLVYIINNHADKEFWFIGQTHTSEFYAKARNLSNCKFWGTLRQADAELLVSQFDMALTPFLDNPLVRSMSPMKNETYKKNKVPQVPLVALKPAPLSKRPAKSIKRAKT
jgi:hypothetical protein